MAKICAARSQWATRTRLKEKQTCLNFVNILAKVSKANKVNITLNKQPFILSVYNIHGSFLVISQSQHYLHQIEREGTFGLLKIFRNRELYLESDPKLV